MSATRGPRAPHHRAPNATAVRQQKYQRRADQYCSAHPQTSGRTRSILRGGDAADHVARAHRSLQRRQRDQRHGQATSATAVDTNASDALARRIKQVVEIQADATASGGSARITRQLRRRQREDQLAPAITAAVNRTARRRSPFGGLTRASAAGNNPVQGIKPTNVAAMNVMADCP